METETFCPDCGSLLPGDCSEGCADDVEGFDSLVDKLQALRGMDREEAEKLAEDILEEDSA